MHPPHPARPGRPGEREDVIMAKTKKKMKAAKKAPAKRKAVATAGAKAPRPGKAAKGQTAAEKASAEAAEPSRWDVLFARLTGTAAENYALLESAGELASIVTFWQAIPHQYFASRDDQEARVVAIRRSVGASGLVRLAAEARGLDARKIDRADEVRGKYIDEYVALMAKPAERGRRWLGIVSEMAEALELAEAVPDEDCGALRQGIAEVEALSRKLTLERIGALCEVADSPTPAESRTTLREFLLNQVVERRVGAKAPMRLGGQTAKQIKNTIQKAAGRGRLTLPVPVQKAARGSGKADLYGIEDLVAVFPEIRERVLRCKGLYLRSEVR